MEIPDPYRIEMPARNAPCQSFEDRLKIYSDCSKTAHRNTLRLGGAASCCAGTVAALVVGTTEAEAAVTITNVNLVLNPSAGNFSGFVLDIAGYGVAEDFEFQASSDPGVFDFFRMGDRVSTLVIGVVSGGYNYPLKMNLGDPIPGGPGFLPGDGVVNSYLAVNYLGVTGGDWAGGATGYVGFQITTGADVNYGWLEIRVDADNAGGEIIRYGIESDAGVAVVAGVPEVNSLAYLAVGAAGLLGWRQRRQKSA